MSYRLVHQTLGAYTAYTLLICCCRALLSTTKLVACAQSNTTCHVKPNTPSQPHVLSYPGQQFLHKLPPISHLPSSIIFMILIVTCYSLRSALGEGSHGSSRFCDFISVGWDSNRSAITPICYCLRIVNSLV